MAAGLTSPVIRIGISRCLLGDEVRYDGGHKQDPFVAGTLAKFFQWISVCPEVELGLSVPREPLRLVETEEGIRMIGLQTGKDITNPMNSYASSRTKELLGLHGYILKKDSPSCGMERVKVFDGRASPRKRGRGLFADALMRRYPNLPVEEEGRLHDPVLRENFIERVFCYHRWSEFLQTRPKHGKLVDFHAGHKLTLLSHSRMHYNRLGKLVSEAGTRKFPELLRDYGTIFMEALKLIATPSKHANVLYHLLGYLKKDIDASDRSELVSNIENYRKGLLPLIVPISLFLHHFRRHPVDWIRGQTYLNPYPAELMLRNHV